MLQCLFGEHQEVTCTLNHKTNLQLDRFNKKRRKSLSEMWILSKKTKSSI